ncbi:hypothetical protein DYB32_007193 [Aphanomyces invadans]|uniref:Uncharacterized protein n=1 Tax=Aphanomyces invadans TaxID=157072 RepID=A0A418APG1_9STRA|nr:hypothetical protein DYB32_007193 [Aphanomyces invadans]
MDLPPQGKESDDKFEVEASQRLVINHTDELSSSTDTMDVNMKKHFVKVYVKTKEFEDSNKYLKKDGLYFLKTKHQV